MTRHFLLFLIIFHDIVPLVVAIPPFLSRLLTRSTRNLPTSYSPMRLTGFCLSVGMIETSLLFPVELLENKVQEQVNVQPESLPTAATSPLCPLEEVHKLVPIELRLE